MKVKNNDSRKLKIDLDESTLTFLQNAKEAKASGGHAGWFAQARNGHAGWFAQARHGHAGWFTK